jgi:DNA-3-methyladenine glycosylase
VAEAPAWTAADLVARTFLDRPGPQVAPDLLGCVLEHDAADGLVAVMLTEVEAYNGETDPASHAYRGRTKRNAVMYGEAGHAYVYFTYGMHFCVNVVCMPEGAASAVLIRAGKVIAGEPLARARRASSSDRDLARGPARLCQALAIDRRLDGADLCVPDSPLRLRAPLRRPPAGARGDGADAPVRSGQKNLILSGPRVGVREGAEVPWRFWLDGEPTVSPYRPYAPRRRQSP